MWSRLIVDLLFYLGVLMILGFIILQDRTDLLYIAIACFVISFVLFIFKGSNRQIRDDYSTSRYNSLTNLTDLLEIPFRLFMWLGRKLFSIFD